MKKIISMILVCVLLVGMLFTLASCGKKLKGSYSCEVGGMTMTYEFKGNKFTLTTEMEVLGQKVTTESEGTYKIKGDEITITMEIDGEEFENTGSFEKGKDYIVIDGVKLTKN